MPSARNYWLLKSEAEEFSIEDLSRKKTEPWSGVRNFQARGFLRSMQVGDFCLFYHTGKEKSVVGVARVTSEPYPDKTQFDAESPYFDPKSSRTNPIWTLVDISFVKKFKKPVTLAQMKKDPKLRGMVLLKAPRLSVQPVSEKHFNYIVGPA